MVNKDDYEYYLSIERKPNEFFIFSSGSYKLDEIDLIALIKITLVEGRNKRIGKKLLNVYIDSTKNRAEMTNERLKLIGIENEKREPIKARKSVKK